MAYTKVPEDEEAANGTVGVPSVVEDHRRSHERPPLAPTSQPLHFEAPEPLILGYPASIVRTSGFMALNVVSSIGIVITNKVNRESWHVSGVNLLVIC